MDELGQGPVMTYLAALAARLRGETRGTPATYIPELGKADPALFGIAVVTVDGRVYAVGDAAHRFTIQSVSKPFTYAHALDRLGRDAVGEHVGVEPTGESFNAILLDEANNRPFNAMVNAGAIAVAELIAGDDDAARRASLNELMARFAGRPLALDEAVYASEKATGHRNRAIAWMMLNTGMIRRDPEAVLDLYFRQCSLLVDVRDLATMGATLANDGVNPRTGERACRRRHVADVLTVMNMCGMYNYAGQWSYEIGLPAKSGVSGGLLLVIPGQAGVAIFSPALDAIGHSVRGVAAARAIAHDFGLHIFATHADPRSVVRIDYRGDRIRSRRARGPEERQRLDAAMAGVHIVEAQDALFFGSTERLVRRCASVVDEADWLVLDLRRVWSADRAAERLLSGLAEQLAAAGKRLVVADADRPGLEELHAALDDAGARLFATRDAALEHVEDALLAAQAPVVAPAFATLQLVDGLEAGDVERLRQLAQPVRFARGEALAREGEPGDSIYAIERGRVRIALALDDGRSLGLGSAGPGMTCGEMALIERGARSADLIAEDAVAAWRFDLAALDALAAERPEVMIRLVANVARDLARRLRAANGELRALEA